MGIMQLRSRSEKKLENNPIYFNPQFTDVMASASNCQALQKMRSECKLRMGKSCMGKRDSFVFDAGV
jgi:hypothetical protein